MEIQKLAICSATQEKDFKNTLLYKSAQDFVTDANIDLIFVTENKDPLAKVYNAILKDLRECGEYDGVVFVHDDVILEHDPTPNLRQYFDQYDMIGVAGCSRVELKEPALWHLMGGGFGSPNLHGFAAHMHDGVKRMTPFGSYPSRVLYIDGVFMAFNRHAIENMEFDETSPSSFHFYDLNACDIARKKGLKIGVSGITITHNSHGLSAITEDWKVGQQYFLAQHNV
jgi:GT2 family glycosyltransferase